MTNSNKTSNVSPLMQAASEIRKGEKAAASGAAMLTVALAQAMDAHLSYKVGDDSFAFTLAEYREPFNNPDGTKSGKHQSARLTAIMIDLLGEPEDSISNAVKTAFNKCYPAAVLIRFDPLFNKITVKGGSLVGVPLSYAIDLDSAPVQKKVLQGIQTAAQLSGKELTEGEALTEAYNLTVAASGNVHPLFGKLPTSPQAIATLGEEAQKLGYVAAKAPRTPRNGAATESKVDDLNASFDFLIKVMNEQVNEGETDFPFNQTLTKKAYVLWGLLQRHCEAEELI